MAKARMSGVEIAQLDERVLMQLSFSEPITFSDLCKALGMVDKGDSRLLSGRVNASLQRHRKASMAKPAPKQKGWLRDEPKVKAKRAPAAARASSAKVAKAGTTKRAGRAGKAAGK